MNILYISYDGISDPIGQSQIAPYIRGLSSKDANFTVLTFEKEKNSHLTDGLLDKKISWRKLRYHKLPPVISTCYDILKGTVIGLCILAKEKTKIVHARGYVPAMMALILKGIFGLKFIFDMRGLWAEEKVDAGVWKQTGLLYKITKYFEKIFFLYADQIIVLTNSLKKEMEKSHYIEYKDIVVIPTCADINHFLPIAPLSIRRRLGLDAKFIIIYFGSLGTFYAFRPMLDFFSVISKYCIEHPFFFILTNNPSDSIYRIIRLKNISEEDFQVAQMSYNELKKVLPVANVSLMFYNRLLSKTGCCPTKFAESLTCGLPVVINSGIGDTAEIIRKERVGVVVDGFSQPTYKRAAGQLMQLLTEEDVLRQRCRAVAEKYFSLNEGIEKYWQSYQRLLNR